jgi:predicted dehydrogenase
MTKTRIGVIGCGNISMTYMRNAAMFNNIELAACADIVPETAAKRAAEYGIEPMTAETLLARKDIDIVLNLTVPTEHYPVSKAALEAGKHVFTEKPLAVSTELGRALVELAAEKGLALASAPDTFFGAAGRKARSLIEDGRIGPVIGGTAYMMGHGMEHWHPAPSFYYQKGAGPILDMGPYYISMLLSLLGPARQVFAMTSIGNETRTITADGPNKGTSFGVTTETTAMAVIRFASGAIVNLGISWDVWAQGHPFIELYGREGSLRLPDPDTYGGDVLYSDAGGDWQSFKSEDSLLGAINWPYDAPRIANYRTTAVAEMADAIQNKRKPRACGSNALHVLEVLEAVLKSGQTNAPVELTSTYELMPLLRDEDITALLK